MLIKKWHGNTTSDISLKDESFDRLFEFCAKHGETYVFGEGKIGSSLAHYLRQSDMAPVGFITSKTFEEFKSKYQKGSTGIIIGVSDKNLSEILPLLHPFIAADDVFILPADIRENIGERFDLERIEKNFWLNVFTTNICNLNCKSCSTFAPVCAKQPDHYEAEQFEKDLACFKGIGFEEIGTLKFTGGEPFLHPQLFRLLSCARRLYPNAVIECYTNGLKLAGMEEQSLKRIKELDVQLVITEYPLSNLRLDTFYESADKIGLGYSLIQEDGEKYFSKRPLNFDRSTPKYQFVNCPRYKMCDSLFLFKGKMYQCIYTFASAYINREFDKNLKILDADYIDLYSATKQQILEFCRTRIPFCGYCEPISSLVPWGLSEGKIEEWT